jgi:hypothetical protein
MAAIIPLTRAAGPTIIVSSLADTTGDVCTLRQALLEVNTGTVSVCGVDSPETIAFGVSGTIALSAPLVIDRSITIQGPATGITLDGQSAVQLLQVRDGTAVSIDRATFTRGNTPDNGGAISNSGLLTVTNSSFTVNSATAPQTATSNVGNGGAIYNDGALAVSFSTFSVNSATGPTVGYGGTGGHGGGIYNTGRLTVMGSTFAGNRAGGPQGPGQFGGFGGGVWSSGPFVLTGSTFSDNRASFAGGIWNSGTLAATNATFFGNVAGRGNGGGIANAGELTVAYSTFTGNSAEFTGVGGGIFAAGASTVTLESTIVANSTKGGNCGGSVVDGGYNLADDASCGLSAETHSFPNTPAELNATLGQESGGSPAVVPPLPASMAVNAIPAGVNGCGTTVPTDQRGIDRPQGTGCDIGSAELEVTQIAMPTPTPFSPPTTRVYVPSVYGPAAVQPDVGPEAGDSIR